MKPQNIDDRYTTMVLDIGEYVRQQAGVIIEPPLTSNEARGFHEANKIGLLEERLRVLPHPKIGEAITQYFAQNVQ